MRKCKNCRVPLHIHERMLCTDCVRMVIITVTSELIVATVFSVIAWVTR